MVSFILLSFPLISGGLNYGHANIEFIYIISPGLGVSLCVDST